MMMNKVSERVFEDFDPVSDLISEEGCDTVILYLPGFKKEQLKVQLTTTRILRISGERPTGDNKWRRFNKEFRIPQNVDTKEITAKFEGGILHIRQPKLIISAADEEQNKAKQAAEVAKPQTQPQPERNHDGFATPPSDFSGSQEHEAKTEKKEKREEEDKIASKGEMRSKGELAEGRKQVVYGSRLFKELRKPETQKKLAVSVLLPVLLTLLGFYIANMYRSYSGDDQQSVIDFEHQGFLRPT